MMWKHPSFATDRVRAPLVDPRHAAHRKPSDRSRVWSGRTVGGHHVDVGNAVVESCANIVLADVTVGD